MSSHTILAGIMGSRVNIVSVNVLDNPAAFTDSFKLEITFEAFEALPHGEHFRLLLTFPMLEL